MVLALIEELASTRGLREALPFLEGMVSSAPETSARAILRAARAAGLVFTDSAAFNIVSQLKANLNIRDKFKVLELDELPGADTLERAVSPLSKNYSFLVRIAGFNSVTGSRESRFISVVSDKLLTPLQVITTANGVPSGNPGSQILSNQTITVERAMVSPLAP